jgi:uncharacterized YccA/Bax inhibitor family protein
VASADSARDADRAQGPQQPDAIEREMEETRARLASTIDELVNRTSPKRVVRREVASVKATFVDEHGNPRTDNILKVAGGVAGFVVLLVVIRRVTR